MPMREVVYDREKLYQEVWEDPMVKVAKCYGVSDVALAKTCKKLGVPVPSRGYWARLASGQKPLKPGLGQSQGPQRIVIQVWDEPATLVAERDRVWHEMLSGLPAWEPIRVSTSQDKLYPLSEKARKGLQKAKDKNNPWVRSGSGALDMSVSDSSLERAVLLFDTLVKACEQRGYPVSIKEHDRRSDTIFQIMGESVRVALCEKTTRIDHMATSEEIKRQSSEPWCSLQSGTICPVASLFSRSRKDTVPLFGTVFQIRIGIAWKRDWMTSSRCFRKPPPHGLLSVESGNGRQWKLKKGNCVWLKLRLFRKLSGGGWPDFWLT
jgi:hypothetical protein